MSTESAPKTKNPFEDMSLEDMQQKEAELRKRLEEARKQLEQSKEEDKNANPELRKKWKDLEKRKEELKNRKLESGRKKKEIEDQADTVRVAFAKINPKEFVEVTPKRRFFDPEFMRYITGEQYTALMESDRLADDEKERATETRLKFCYDWLKNSPEMQEYFEKKEAYENAYKEWLENRGDNPNEPEPELVKKGAPEIPYNTPLGAEVKELLRNTIKNVNEFGVINRYMPDLFNHFEFVGAMKLGMIQKMREHDAFSGRKRHIREVKFKDFHEILDLIKGKGIGKRDSKEYFETFNIGQLEVIRERVRIALEGKGQEVAAGGSSIHQFPAVMDLYGKSVLQGFKGNDPEEQRAIIKHMLIAEALSKSNPRILTPQNKSALKWLRSSPSGQKFYDDFNGVAKEVGEEMGVEVPRLDEKVGPEGE